MRVVLTKYAEAPVGDRWTEQNTNLVRATLTKDAPILAKQGSMVAYQGDIDFAHKGSGLLGKLTGALTGQGMSLMRCTGNGEVFLADEASRVFVIRLQGEQIYTSAQGVLAFDESLETEVRRIEGAGLPGGGFFSMLFSGTGAVVVKTRGVPVVLPSARPPTSTATPSSPGPPVRRRSPRPRSGCAAPGTPGRPPRP